MSLSEYERRVLKIAEEILSMRPGSSPKAALREAKAIAKTRDTYQVKAEHKVTAHNQGTWKEVPDHIKRTIQKQRQADLERQRSGRRLPKGRKVSGGKVSSK